MLYLQTTTQADFRRDQKMVTNSRVFISSITMVGNMVM